MGRVTATGDALLAALLATLPAGLLQQLLVLLLPHLLAALLDQRRQTLLLRLRSSGGTQAYRSAQCGDGPFSRCRRGYGGQLVSRGSLPRGGRSRGGGPWGRRRRVRSTGARRPRASVRGTRSPGTCPGRRRGRPPAGPAPGVRTAQAGSA